MNVGQIKAFLGEKAPPVHPNDALKQQLQQDGLKQAAQLTAQTNSSVSMSASQTSIGLRIVSGSLAQSVSVDGKNPSAESLNKNTGKTEDRRGLFDFEEVAKNVLRFVGGVIEGAAKSGADESKLTNLFGQARSGVAKGIAMAKRDIGSLMNDEINTGIKRSEELIGNGIDSLEERLIGKKDVSETQSGEEFGMRSSSRAGELLIRTKDGDELTLRFESQQQFSYYQSRQLSALTESGSTNENAQAVASSSSTYIEFFQRSGVSFSLQGELDESEMTAIADLVGRVNDLADTFYAGDLDKAFDDALSLGFDDKELVGYALQLTRKESTAAVSAYEAIQHYNEDKPDANKYGNAVSPIAQYLDKMLKTMDLVGQNLQDAGQYNNLINGLVSEMKDVQVPDLVSAINRFHMFNNKLLDALPANEPVQQTTDVNDNNKKPA